MKRICLTLTVCAGILSYSASAAEKYDTKAFRVITKLCTPCHGTPFYMAKQIDEDDWTYFFNTPGKLEKIHKTEPKALDSLKKSLFQKRKKRLLKFFVANSKFSGNVHGCDANFCGTHH